MILFQIIRDYLSWHYTRGVVDYLKVWGNFLHFFLNFFSIQLLLATLLSPWRRMVDDTETSPTDFYEIFSRIIINIISRLIGLFIRGIVIIIGLITLILSIFLGFVGFLVWFILPVGVLVLAIAGFQLLFSS